MREDDNIKVGSYIVVQRQNYKKLHKFNKPNSCIALGKDTIELLGIEGCKYFSLFKMIAKGNKKNRSYCLEACDEAVTLKNEIDVRMSGADNRNIFDDGNSQRLTASDIEDLKSDATSATDIVESLISNSNTFASKTEYSQEKYLKKKEKKYFDYIQIIRPNLRIIADIMFKLDSSKIQGVRLDTLSQIITTANIYSEGTYLLYDSGSNGLLAAALLSSIGHISDGKLINMHPGNMSQKQALLALNFPEKQYNKCTSVNIYSVLRQFYQGCDIHDNEEKLKTPTSLKRKAESGDDVHVTKIAKVDDDLADANITVDDTKSDQLTKKPKWHYDNLLAAELLQKKVDALVIVCKEDPKNIFKELVNFVKPGRPFVIYYNVAEPLQYLYTILKSESNIGALKLTCNWMRNYQILPDRTHPEVTMSGSSGFLLSGYILK